ncbi:hypothetical protein B0O80DRAFT_445718 [Mortierella sp. GBAus27b]|nr:hypothetical protein B0O80DRAFT_445718 [Mortierella sp. GBAus27b]
MARSPLHIQELVETVGRYLGRADLARCARVCKSWHDIFAPLLYRDVIHNGDLSRQILGIQRHNHHMRTLSMTISHLPVREIYWPECQFLTVLILKLHEYSFRPDQWCSRLVNLIDLNPNIHSFAVHLPRDLGDVLFHEHHILSRMPGLRNLHITSDTCPNNHSVGSGDVMDALAECGPQLETLEYSVFCNERMHIDRMDSGASNQCIGSNNVQLWTRLSSLVLLDNHGHRDVDIVSRSPNLRRFRTGSAQSQHELLQLLIRHHMSGHPSRLEHLAMPFMRGSRTQDALEAFLKICADSTRLKSISIHQVLATISTIDALSTYHGESLTDVKVGGSWTDSGSNDSGLSRLFTKCPQLRRLELRVVSDKSSFQDLVRTPWACVHLRTLVLSLYRNISRPSGSQSTPLPDGQPGHDHDHITQPQRQFWKQIGRLKHLEELFLDQSQKGSTQASLGSIVCEDIEHLYSLERLRELRIPREQEFLGPVVQKQLTSRKPDGLRIVFC